MKKPSILGDLDLSAINEPDTSESGISKPAPAAPVAKSPNLFRTSLYMPHEVREVLREIAFQERKTPHDLFIEGIEHILKTRRHPSIKELAKRKAS